MEGTFIKFSALEEYVNTLNRIFQQSSQTQDEVATEYNRVVTLWNDKISALTGQGLNAIGATVMEMHATLSNILSTVNARYEKMSQGYAERNWQASFNSCEFQVKIKLEGNMSTDTINGTTVEGIKSFERALDVYINDTVLHVRSIRNAHDAVGSSWRDDQYRRVDDKINDFVGTMNKQLNALKQLQEWIEIRRKQFEEALDITFKD